METSLVHSHAPSTVPFSNFHVVPLRFVVDAMFKNFHDRYRHRKIKLLNRRENVRDVANVAHDQVAHVPEVFERDLGRYCCCKLLLLCNLFGFHERRSVWVT